MGLKRVVNTAFWIDGKVDEFSPEDKYFMLYLLTNPFANLLGIYEISIKQAAFQMGYSMEAFSALLDRFENKYHMIRFSKETNEVAILNYLRHSVIKGGKPVEDSLKKDIKAVKNKSLLTYVFSHVEKYDGLNDAVKNVIGNYKEQNGIVRFQNDEENGACDPVGSMAYDSGFGNGDGYGDGDGYGVSYPVSSHDTYHDTSHDTSNHEKNEQVKRERIDYQKIIDLYNTLCPSLPAVRSLSEARKNAIGARLKTYTVEDFRTVFENAQASSFLKGGNNRNWTANFDWLMKDANMAKVLDGNYRDRQGKSGSTGLQINRDDYDHGSQVPW